MYVPNSVPGAPLSLAHYRFYSENKTSFVAIALNSLAFGVTQYPGWEEFRDQFLDHWQALHRDLQPALLTRVGVRFINLFRADETTGETDALAQVRFEKPYLKPLEDRPIVHQSVTSYRRDEGRITVQVILPENEQELRIDYDAAAENVDSGPVRDVIEELHRLIENHFFGSITRDLAESLKPTQEVR